MSTFNKLIENENIIKAVEEMGYIKPTKIQEKAIPLLKEGKDMIAKSNTGTGKTAAFGLPLIEKTENEEFSLSIILCPTRELALQAETELEKFSKYVKNLKIVSVYGGAPINKQIRLLKEGCHIIVGTPGRVQDHIKRKTIRLKNCDCVILDEADEMLNMGFREDIENILKTIETPHQTIMFSATMPKEIREIAETYLYNPVEIEVKSKQKTVDKITQHYYDIKASEKIPVLKKLISYYESDLSIIFCNTKAKVDDVVEELNKMNIKAVGLHGDIKQEKRTKIMNSFKRSKKAVLVASDVAARGIDVNNIDLVVNFDLPQEKETYIHRIGRTGRAGKEGIAITFIHSGRQYKQLKALMKYIKTDIEKKEVPTEEELQTKKRNAFKELIFTQAQEGVIQEHLQFANEMLKDGLENQELVSALISIAYGGHMIPEPKKKKKEKQNLKEGIELKFSLGKTQKITYNDLQNAILSHCDIKEKEIGKIDIRKQYSIVMVDKRKAQDVITYMHRTKIKNKRCEVYYYKKNKTSRNEYRS